MSTPRRPERPTVPAWTRVNEEPRDKPRAQRPTTPKASTATREARGRGPKREVTRQATPPQRRAGDAISDAAKGTANALGTVLERAKTKVVDPAQVRDERERERRSAQRKRLAITWGRRLGYVIIAAALVWVVLLSPAFALDPEKVTVTGYGTVVDPTEVREVIDAHEGGSLATLRIGHLASELQDIPGVRQAHVQRSWPDGLTVTLESREPVAAVPERSGGFAFVDDEGVQVGRADSKPKDLPVLNVPVDTPDKKALMAALTVINAMPPELMARITSISAQTADSVSFSLSKGPKVEWGSAEDNDVKAQVLTVLLESKQAAKADVIDVSAPTLPITKNG